jgi:predicted transposase YbfD/YdcC
LVHPAVTIGWEETLVDGRVEQAATDAREGLLDRLGELADPRDRRGVRHSFVSLLAIAVAAVGSGARSWTEIGEFARELTPEQLARLGARPSPYTGRYTPPDEATIRRALQRVDPQALDRLVGGWLGARQPPADTADGTAADEGVAVDGKTLRGAVDTDGHRVHLLAAFHQQQGMVLAQRRVDGKTNEITQFRPLLDRLDLTDTMVTADALHTHGDAAEFLVTVKQAHYLFVVKANQPTLLDRCARLAWHNVPVLDRTRYRAHGRVELRTLKAVTVRRSGFPHTAQVIQITRRVCDLRSRRWRTVVVYAVTSLTHAQASPARLADLIRGHWTIENGLHYVRDVTFAEDVSQVRTGTGPQVMACLRNLAIGALSRAGPVNLAAALRHHARDPRRPLAILGITLG